MCAIGSRRAHVHAVMAGCAAIVETSRARQLLMDKHLATTMISQDKVLTPPYTIYTHFNSLHVIYSCSLAPLASIFLGTSWLYS